MYWAVYNTSLPVYIQDNEYPIPINDFAVNANQPAVFGTQGFYPDAELLFHHLRVQTRKETVKGVVRRYAVGQEQITLEKLFLTDAKVLNVRPVLCAADDGGYGYKHDVGRQMANLPFLSVIR